MVESDEEQIEVLKKWWDENGTTLVTTIVLAGGLTFGYRAWEDNVRETAEAASGIYENMLQASTNAADENLRTTALSLGDQLKTEHADSTYAVFAALHLAKIAVEAGEIDKAQSELEWVLTQKPEKRLETMTRMRLARVLMAKGDSTAAMARLVNHEPLAGQKSSWEEVRGDVYLALGDDTNARQSYQMALQTLDNEVSRPILELKLADIPLDSGIPAQPGAEDNDA